MWILILSAVLATMQPAADPDFEALFERGTTYETFLENAERRHDMWHRNTEWAVVPDPLLNRARQAVDAAGGTLHLLAVAVDGCSDSANTIPYMAALVRQVDGLDMRIIDSAAGAEIMASHRTPDGRPATPTVLVLDSDFLEVGAFIERPVPLEDWYAGLDSTLSSDERLAGKFEWYDADRGASTQEEVVAIMEAAGLPDIMTGSFSDDYGSDYTVSATAFVHDDTGRYHIMEWNVDGQFAIAQNDRDNTFAPGMWTRLDWIPLPDMAPWTWAFCLSAYDAGTADAARSAVEPDRSKPMTGCFGHPFTRMKRP